jgi:hypothetical protein
MGWLSVGAGPVRVGTRGFSVGAGGVRAGASWRGSRSGGGGGKRAESSYDHPALVQARDEHLEWAERVLDAIETDGLPAHSKLYKRLVKHARWLDKLHANCCGLETHFRDALLLDVRQITFGRELKEAASSFAGKTRGEVAETVRGLNQAAVQLDRDLLRLFPDLDVSTLYTSRVNQIARDYAERNHFVVPPLTVGAPENQVSAGSTVTADTNSELLDRIISLMDELNRFPATIVNRLTPSPWLSEMLERVNEGRCAEVDTASWLRMERELIDLKRSIITGLRPTS